jgi:hypothetical protein
MRSSGLLALTALTTITGHSCMALGLSDEVLWRVPSPDGQMVVVCQEIPELDGPGYEVRLERPDGSALKRLYEIGDADGCSEMVWAPDGRTLAVLTAHVARVRFVDVAWALENPTIESHYWSSRMISFSSDFERQLMLGRNLRFTGPLDVELDVCDYERDDNRRTGTRECAATSTTKRFGVPVPIDGSLRRSAGRRSTGERRALVIP